MEEVFKDKTKERGVSITDLVLTVLQLLRRDLQAAVDFIKPVELWDKGQLSYIVSLVYIGSLEYKYIIYLNSVIY